MPYDTHTGPSIAIIINQIGDQWGLEKVHCLVRDNVANLVNGCQLSGIPTIGCLDHILSLIIKHSIEDRHGVMRMRKRLRKLIMKLNSSKAAAIFKKIQILRRVTPKALVLSFKTRWNINLNMFTTANGLKEDFKIAQDDPYISIPIKYKLGPGDWDLIPKLLSLLQPLNVATLLFEGDNSSISEVVPIIKRLKLHLTSINESGVTTLKYNLLKNKENYLGGKDQRDHFCNVT